MKTSNLKELLLQGVHANEQLKLISVTVCIENKHLKLIIITGCI